MHGKLIIEGNAVYEIDEACLCEKEKEKEKKSENTNGKPDKRKRGGY